MIFNMVGGGGSVPFGFLTVNHPSGAAVSATNVGTGKALTATKTYFTVNKPAIGQTSVTCVVTVTQAGGTSKTESVVFDYEGQGKELNVVFDKIIVPNAIEFPASDYRLEPAGTSSSSGIKAEYIENTLEIKFEAITGNYNPIRAIAVNKGEFTTLHIEGTAKSTRYGGSPAISIRVGLFSDVTYNGSYDLLVAGSTTAIPENDQTVHQFGGDFDISSLVQDGVYYFGAARDNNSQSSFYEFSHEINITSAYLF